MPSVLARAFVVLTAMLVVPGCSLSDQTTGLPAGPSELGLSVLLTATPDVIVQDGASQSLVAVLARDAAGQPAGGVSFRVDIEVDGKSVEFGALAARSVGTNSSGRATVTYTAPPPPPVGVDSDTTVTIVFTILGTDFAANLPRAVRLRLVRPGVTAPPAL